MKRFILILILATVFVYRIIEINLPKPTYAKVFFSLGIEHEQNKNYNKAIESFHKSLFHDPRYYLSLHHLGKLFKKTGDQVNRLKVYEDILALGSDKDNTLHRIIYSRANYELGLNYKESGNYDKAIAHLSEAVINENRLSEGYYELALIYSLLKEERINIITKINSFNNPYKNTNPFAARAADNLRDNRDWGNYPLWIENSYLDEL